MSIHRGTHNSGQKRGVFLTPSIMNFIISYLCEFKDLRHASSLAPQLTPAWARSRRRSLGGEEKGHNRSHRHTRRHTHQRSQPASGGLPCILEDMRAAIIRIKTGACHRPDESPASSDACVHKADASRRVSCHALPPS